MIPATNTDFEIPQKVGVMLLSGTVLFPNCHIDLQIFEPRYRKMLSDALERDWVFCIGDLTKQEEDSPRDCVAEIGTAALIKASKTLDDGRSLLVVSGISPVKFESWDRSFDYPCAEISPVVRTPMSDEDGELVKAMLIDTLPECMEKFSDDLKELLIENLNGLMSYSAVIDCVAHNFIADSDLRRELLCEIDDKARASKLIAALSK